MTRKLTRPPASARRARWLPVLIALLLAGGGALPARAATVNDIRYSSNRERTRVVLDLSAAAQFTHRPLADPPRVVVELPGAGFASGVAPFSIGDGYVRRVRLNELRSGKIQVVLDLSKLLDYSVLVLKGPDRIVVDVKHAGKPAPEPEPAKAKGTGKTKPAEKPAAPSAPAEASERSAPSVPVPIPAPPRNGPWVVAVDAGHGGDDQGAHYLGTNEKDITLDLCRELTDELNRRSGIRAYMVRRGDYFIPLYQRRTIAHKDSADLFVSIHCNASRNPSAKGTEVYFLSLKGASDEAAKELAKRENEVDEKMGVAPEAPDLDQILFDMRQTDVLAKSQILAETCLHNLFKLGTVYDRGVKQAGFAVLKFTDIPSVLVEAAFLSNRQENRLLRSGKWQRDFARYMADGIESYCKNVERAEHLEHVDRN
jgi:N-acetylmuramoyl-L-alanine amidase